MPTIYCSKKLESLLPKGILVPASEITPSPLGDWNAHLFNLQRKKCLVLVNNLCFFVVFINNITKKDLANMDVLVRSRIFEQMYSELPLPDKVVYKLAGALQPLSLVRTNNDKRALGVINDSIFIWKVHCEHKYGTVDNMPVKYENGMTYCYLGE